MKNFKRIFALALLILTVASLFPASASVPYATYTYSIDGEYLESPHAYVPYTVINSDSMGLDTPLSSVKDFFVASDGRVYISDSANKRVIVLSEDFKFLYEYSTFVNEWGVPDSISAPSGLCVTGDSVYICDTDNSRILEFKTTGDYEFVRIIEEPDSQLFPDNHIYRPVAVAVGNSGYIYVVSSTTYQGIISMNSKGEFTGFLGTQSATISLTEMIWRKFQTTEQRNKSAKNVSTEFNNIAIDDEGFIYVTTASIKEESLLSAINSKSKDGTYAPVKKLNPSGNDVMVRSGFYPPSGEINVNTMITPNTTVIGPSKIVDVALGPEGTWSIIDQKRQRVFTYDEDGRLLFAFGDKGNQLGNIQNIGAIDYQGDNMLILDATNNNITVFKRTEYGDVIATALKHQRERMFDRAKEGWTDILQRNTNFDLAYVGIGRSLYRSNQYKDSLVYFEAAYDTENWSTSYQEIRKEWIEKYVILVPIIAIVFFVLLSKFMSYAAKVNREAESSKKKRTFWVKYLYGFHIMGHPFDGFWDMKHEKRGSAASATVALVLTVLAFIYNKIGCGYVMNPNPAEVSIFMVICSVLLPVILWVVANWCLTTLFDGEGSLKDIYTATCYALYPLPPIMILGTLFSNFVTSSEVSLISLLISIGYIWAGFLLFFGMMVVHDYSLSKNVITTLGTIVGMAFIMFIAVLFSSLLGKMYSFVSNIIIEISYRL